MKHGSVCIGVFDGVHRGHKKIIQTTVREARRLGLAAVGVTFDPHPAEILNPSRKPPRLQALSQRIWHMRRLGLDRILVIRFNSRFSRVPAPSFVKHFLSGFLKVRVLCVGADFRFGAGGRGGIAELRKWAKPLGYRVRIVRPVRAGRCVISSTRIRRLVTSGRLAEASALLGRPVSLYGRVVRGKGRGRHLGFPTVNLRPFVDTLPPSGVYAVRARTGGRFIGGVLHLGPRPTFGESVPSIETHLFNTHKSFYGNELEIYIYGKIRAVRRFSRADELKKRIHKDITLAKAILKKDPRLG